MDVVWAPWRMKYILGSSAEGCIFCDKPKENRDADNYILVRGKTCFAMLNTFPYNNGHLMVVPYRHEKSLHGLHADELAEMMRLSALCEGVLSDKLRPEGFNLGINIGKTAGAGIDSHLHLHLVPRWNGDTNFMPVIADTKVIPDTLGNTYNTLQESLQKAMADREFRIVED